MPCGPRLLFRLRLAMSFTFSAYFTGFIVTEKRIYRYIFQIGIESVFWFRNVKGKTRADIGKKILNVSVMEVVFVIEHPFNVNDFEKALAIAFSFKIVFIPPQIFFNIVKMVQEKVFIMLHFGILILHEARIWILLNSLCLAIFK